MENADAFLQNLRLGVAERLGIGYEQVRAHKPDIVYLAVSAFGYGGAWQYRPGYEPNAQAITGMQARKGGADRPAGQPFAIDDYCTGLLGAFGLGLGLFHRLRTGEDSASKRRRPRRDVLANPIYADLRGQGLGRAQWTTGARLGPLQRLYRAADAWFFLGAQEAQLTPRLHPWPASRAWPCRRAIGSTARSVLPREASERVGALISRGWHRHAHARQCDAAHARSLGEGSRAQRDSSTQRWRHNHDDRPARAAVAHARVPGRPVSLPGGDAKEVLAMIGMADRLNELVEKR